LDHQTPGLLGLGLDMCKHGVCSETESEPNSFDSYTMIVQPQIRNSVVPITIGHLFMILDTATYQDPHYQDSHSSDADDE